MKKCRKTFFWWGWWIALINSICLAQQFRTIDVRKHCSHFTQCAGLLNQYDKCWRTRPTFFWVFQIVNNPMKRQRVCNSACQYFMAPQLPNKDNETRTTNIQRHFSKRWWVIFKYLLVSLLRQISSKSSWTPAAPIGNYIWIKRFVLYGIMGNLLLKQTSSWYDKCSHDHNRAFLSDCLKYPELLCITF